MTPYYNAYAAPYVDAARPYYDVLDKKLIGPTTAYGMKYGAPRLAQAQAFSQAQWEKSIQPRVSKLSGAIQEQYTQKLAPYVKTFVNSTGPYYAIARDSALQTYYASILPTYNALQPYAQQGYEVINKFAVDTGIPYAQWAWTTSAVFLDRTVWPKIRVLYGENVEPQLVRIGERLGRYRDEKKLQATVDEIEMYVMRLFLSFQNMAGISVLKLSRSSSASSASSTLSSISSSIASVHATEVAPSSTVAPPSSQVPSVQPSVKTPMSDQEIRDNARRVVSTDLKTLQEKFAKAADEGSDELDERITEITDRALQNQAQGVGEAHLIQLEETIKSELKRLKSNIISIIKKSSDLETSEKDLTAAVRKAGSAIKDKAQAIRVWRKSYDLEMNTLVSQAATDTFEIIDHIRDLGLQEIGMRWAWTEGITHKDWTKYHAMKTKFDEWRKDVEEVATTHPGLAKAREASEDIENRAMDMAEDAVKELTRLKETGRWKISAGDTSDDFSPKYMPAAAAVADQEILDTVSEASEAVAGTSQRTIESISSAASSSIMDAASSASSAAASQVDNVEILVAEAGKGASSVASSISSSFLDTPQGSVESIASVTKSSDSSLADKAPSPIIGTQQGNAESVLLAAQATASSVADKESSSLIGTLQGSIESIASVASNSASSLAAKMSSSGIGTKPGVVENASSTISSAASALSEAIPVDDVRRSASSVSSVASSSLFSGSSKAASSASSASSLASKSTSSISKDISSSSSSASMIASKKVLGGAMAQFVEAKQIIYEDVLEGDDDSSYSEKMQSMASEAGDKFSDLTKAVSEALLMPTTTQGSVESITSLAAEQYSKALSAASVAYYGTQQGIRESIASVASSRYADAVAA